MRSTEKNQRIFTIALMYLGYASFMMLRTVPATVGPTLVDDPDLDLDLELWGKILAVGTCGGIIGKFVMGWLSDRFGGKFAFSLGLILTIAAIAGFAVCSNAWFFGLALFIALLAKSAGWPAMAKLIGNWFPADQHGRVWGVLSTSSRVGSIIATLCLGWLLTRMSWRAMLVVTAVITVASCVFIIMRLREHPSSPIQEPFADQPTQSTANRPHRLDETTLSTALRYFATSRRFWLITGSLMGLTILWDFLFFVPFFLVDTLDIPKARASMVTSLFPVGSLISVLIGGFIFDKLKGKALAMLMGGMLLIATACIGTFYLLPGWNLNPSTAISISSGVLLVFGFCVSPCYYLPMSIFSIRFGGLHSGMLISILDALGFSSSAVFAYFTPKLTAKFGWSPFLEVLLVICVWSLVTTFIFLIGEAREQSD